MDLFGLFGAVAVRSRSTALGAACLLLTVVSGTGAQSTSSFSAQAVQSPDAPPLRDRIWTASVVADKIGLHPSTIVVGPGQRFTVRFKNNDYAPSDLVFELPGGPSEFDTPVRVGESRISTLIAPRRAGIYTYHTTLNPTGSRGMLGRLIVTPTAATGMTPVFGARDVRIVARDFGFNPSAPFANPGERLRVTLYNAGDRPHNIVFAVPGEQATFDTALAPGEMRTMIVQVPARPGEYTLYDPVSGNRDRGDSGLLIVSRPRNSSGPAGALASTATKNQAGARPTIEVWAGEPGGTATTYHIPSRRAVFAHVTRTRQTVRVHRHAREAVAKHRSARHTTKEGY